MTEAISKKQLFCYLTRIMRAFLHISFILLSISSLNSFAQTEHYLGLSHDLLSRDLSLDISFYQFQDNEDIALYGFVGSLRAVKNYNGTFEFAPRVMGNVTVFKYLYLGAGFELVGGQVIPHLIPELGGNFYLLDKKMNLKVRMNTQLDVDQINIRNIHLTVPSFEIGFAAKLPRGESW